MIAAALAEGRTRATGLAELRVKESDRLAVMAAALTAAGARVTETEDGLIIDGTGGDPLPGGATIAGHLDHRICMSFAVAGLVTVDLGHGEARPAEEEGETLDHRVADVDGIDRYRLRIDKGHMNEMVHQGEERGRRHRHGEADQRTTAEGLATQPV